ncbi:MAG: transposase [Pseudomonadota bacterium]
MPDYRRNRLPGGTYFFTVNLLDRNSDLLMRYIEELREAVRQVRRSRPFYIDAWVVLPEHMHCIWTLPEDDADYSFRWKAIKIRFAKQIPITGHRTQARLRKGERGIWQRRFWEHTIRDDRDYEVHMDYVHINPVKHGLVERVGDWPYSTFHRYVELGVYPTDWAGAVELRLDAGEPIEDR